MKFASAVAIGCLQFLGGTCLFIVVLCVLGLIKHVLVGTEGDLAKTLMMTGAGFSVAALACRWAVSKIRQAAMKTDV